MSENLKSNVVSSHHPDNKSIIIFDEVPHTYTDNNGKLYESGTTFVKKYFEEFDAIAVSEMCSKGRNPKYVGRTPKDIQHEWLIDGEIASQEGTNVHLYFEGRMSDWLEKDLPKPLTERCRLMFLQVDRVVIELKRHYLFIGAEVIIFSITLGKSGMIDLLLWSKALNEIVIFDLKTNKDIRKPASRKAFSPINHLDDTKIAKYSLQLSLYQKILIREKYFPKISGYRRALIHIGLTDFEIIPVEDYSYEIDTLLKHEGILK